MGKTVGKVALEGMIRDSVSDGSDLRCYETSKWYSQVGSVLQSLEFGRVVGIRDFYLGGIGIRQSKDQMRSLRKWREIEMKRRPLLCRTSIFEIKKLLRMIPVVLLVNWRIAKFCMTLRIFAVAPLYLPPRANPLVGKCYANFTVVIKATFLFFSYWWLWK